ncbi:hypothetical protein J4526_06410 [Desulfurococcaceae archaeon MEX13E-LK6-19]|nr:hypothetical protein J4526_06410 [Desulfurococcaceae archaeon MEX13E-LK6-19]
MATKTISLIKKTPGGKTLKIDITINPDEDKIIDIVISGDFFAYPPEKLEELEKQLQGKTLEDAMKTIDDYKKEIELVGTSLQDIKQLIEQAISKKHIKENRP